MLNPSTRGLNRHLVPAPRRRALLPTATVLATAAILISAALSYGEVDRSPTALPEAAACDGYRWPVKTLTDPAQARSTHARRRQASRRSPTPHLLRRTRHGLRLSRLTSGGCRTRT
jgi:hypothetical protein